MRTILLNGSHTVRQRSSDGVTVLPCGCAHTQTRYAQMCAEHFDAFTALHVGHVLEHTVSMGAAPDSDSWLNS